LTRKNPSRYDL